MTNVFRWDPFADMRNSMDALFDQGFSRPWRLMGAADYATGFPVDLWETNDALELRASIPGIAPEDVNISLTGEALTLSYEHRGTVEDTNRRYVLHEIGRGKFQRTIGLHTPVDPDKAEAHYENGMLHLRMPKAESARVRQIRVGEKAHLLN